MITRYNLGRSECYQAWNEHRHSGTGILDVSIQGSLTEGQLPFHPASIPALLTRSTPTLISYQEKQVWITALLQQQGCLIGTPVLSHSQDFHALLLLSLTLDCLFATHTPYFFCPSILPGKGFLCNYFFLVSSILPYLHPVLMVLIPLLGKLSFYRFSSESPMIPSSDTWGLAPVATHEDVTICLALSLPLVQCSQSLLSCRVLPSPEVFVSHSISVATGQWPGHFLQP